MDSDGEPRIRQPHRSPRNFLAFDSVMSDIAAIYNTLPSLEDANEKFIDREATFAKLAPFISKYNNRYGVCLIHAHTQLEPGEVMLSTSDGISEPVKSPVECYPERWLATGQAYEFSSQPVDHPPTPEVFTEFRKIVGADSPLGLFYVDENAAEARIEVTEGRKSILKPGSPPQGARGFETAWVPGTNRKHTICIFCYRCG